METSEADGLIQGKLDEVNALIAPYKLAWVDPNKDCRLLGRNARFMSKSQMERLAENIEKDGFLSQLPFAIRQDDGKFKILSGNHRVKGAIKANQDRVLILYGEEEDYSDQRQTAVQLAHNSIVGQDDLSLLREIYADIEDVMLKAYSGIDEKALFGYKPMEFKAITDDDLALYPLTFTFTTVNRDKVNALLDELEKRPLDPESDALVIGDADEFIALMTDIENRLNIRNRTVAFMKMCQICQAYLKSLTEEKKTVDTLDTVDK